MRKRIKIHYKFSLEILKERDHLEYLGIDGRVILKWKNWVGRYGLGSYGSGYGKLRVLVDTVINPRAP